MKKTTKGLTEMIIVRLNKISDGDAVQGIFLEMTAALKQPAYQPGSACLLRSASVENEWAIYLHHPEKEGEGKSDLAENLAGMLRSVGLVHRTIWKPCEVEDCNELLKESHHK